MYNPRMESQPSELDSLRDFNPQALEAVHTRYYPELYRYARYRLNDDNLAEDVTSEVFVCLLEALDAGRGPKTSLRGWLIGTAANLINSHYRKQYARKQEGLTENLQSEQEDPASGQEMEEQNQALHAALIKLTAEQQHVLALRFGDNYSLEETASLMGKNANAIKQLQFRALASLKRFLQSDEE